MLDTVKKYKSIFIGFHMKIICQLYTYLLQFYYGLKFENLVDLRKYL